MSNPPFELVAPWEWFSIEEVDDTLEQLARVDTVPTPAPPGLARRSSAPVFPGQRSQAYWQRQAARELVEGALARERAAARELEHAEREAKRCKHFLVEVGPGQARCRYCPHSVSFCASVPVTFAKEGTNT